MKDFGQPLSDASLNGWHSLQNLMKYRDLVKADWWAGDWCVFKGHQSPAQVQIIAGLNGIARSARSFRNTLP